MSRPPAVRPPPSEAAVRSTVPVPSPRAVAWLLRRPTEKLTDEERAYVTALTTKCPAISEAQALGDRFARMLQEHEINELASWLSAAEGSALKGFARGIRRDYDAVLAALCFQWSNGQVEGQVHRLKLVKRTMYGRAKFDLLRARVLHAA
ncbi:MAG: ISL3 family transposase [Gemmatimonadaceae bacterium]